MGTERTSESLTRLLRAGDPARTQPPMSASEIATMRRRLAAAGVTERATRWRPLTVAFSGVAAILALIVVGYALGPSRPPPAGSSNARPTDALAIELGPESTNLGPSDRDFLTARVVLRPRQALRRPAIEPSATPPPGRHREVHFTAPRGTRMIWDLRTDTPNPERDPDPEIRS